VCPPAGAGAPIASTLAGGGARVVVRGGGGDRARVVAAVAAARAAGVDEIVVAGHVEDLAEPGAAAALAAAGVDAVALVVVSQVAKVHDRAVGRADSLVATLVAARALAAAGVAIELELPIVPARLQDLAAIVVLFARAVPSVRAVRCYLPRHPMPTALAPPPLADLGPRLDAALAAAEACGARATFDVTAAVPLCALSAGRASRPPRASIHVARRGSAAARSRARAPGARSPRNALGSQRRTAPPTARATSARWRLDRPRSTPSERRRRGCGTSRPGPRPAPPASWCCVRPCTATRTAGFCSANESTPNVWAEPRAMMRAIARAAQRGVERVSFSGGEPTLARELPSYVRVARRAGIAKVELVTNGVLLDQPTRVDALVAAGLTHAFVSLHGHDEASASAATRKAGDFARTIAAIGHLVERGVITVVNHVIHAGNAALLERFVDTVWERFGGRVMISFAFVTPQYQALQHPELVPRLSEVAPYLARAAWRAIDLGQPFVIGSRQGVPPCQLGPFVGWSDLIHVAHEAQAEDAPQKVHGPGCTGCRFARYCTGVWRPYAARYGTDELIAPPGPPLGEPERAVLLAHAGGRRGASRWPSPTSIPGCATAPPRSVAHRRAPPPRRCRRASSVATARCARS
jgi:MoaA/NifB/PqqE/SkfB family radical SAM enzyme